MIRSICAQVYKKIRFFLQCIRHPIRYLRIRDQRKAEEDIYHFILSMRRATDGETFRHHMRWLQEANGEALRSLYAVRLRDNKKISDEHVVAIHNLQYALSQLIILSQEYDYVDKLIREAARNFEKEDPI